MPRPSEEKARIEAERLEILHKQQRIAQKRIKKEIKVKKGGYHLPGEKHYKKYLAIYLKVGVAGISYTEIAERIGEPKGVVKKWFKEDPEVKEHYEWVLTNLKDGAFNLMQTYALEAVETLVLLMRLGSEKYMKESAVEILDRIGLPKTTRQEIESEHKKKHEWSDRESLVGDIRALPPERQEEAIKMLEEFENLLSENADKEDDEDELQPIFDDDNDDSDEGIDG